NRDRLNDAIAAVTRGRSSAEWVERLNAAGVPCGPIYRINEVFEDPQVKHLNITRRVQQPVLGELELVGQPIELSRTPWQLHSATPEPGQHTEEILQELGYSADEITDLRRRRVV
ncbi:MAG: CoA transferase, partial [Acetobacteraceae bacterium]|nr:CoA transferase [Acetobacteraceae bacterium]